MRPHLQEFKDVHEKSVRPIAVTPDGKYFFSGDRAGVIAKWKVSSGKMVSQFKGHMSDLYGFCMGHEGKFLFSAGDDSQIRMWRVSTGKCVRIFNKEHKMWIEGMALSSDGKWLFTGSGDKTIKKWEVNALVLCNFVFKTRI